MAERRMIAKGVVDTDSFMEMPMSTQALYFHLLLRADDEGFLKNAKTITRMTGCKDDDIKILIAKSYLIAFDTGAVAIRHWRIHNSIRKDRFTPTLCTVERKLLDISPEGAYIPVKSGAGYAIETRQQPDGNQLATKWQPSGNQMATKWQPDGNQLATQVRLGKDRLGKDRLESDADKSAISGKATTTTTKPDHKSKRFKKPSIEELKAYITEMGYTFSANHFFDYYESNGWKVGRNGMKSWKAACANWQRREHHKTAAGRREIGGWANESDGWGD